MDEEDFEYDHDLWPLDDDSIYDDDEEEVEVDEEPI